MSRGQFVYGKTTNPSLLRILREAPPVELLPIATMYLSVADVIINDEADMFNNSSPRLSDKFSGNRFMLPFGPDI